MLSLALRPLFCGFSLPRWLEFLELMAIPYLPGLFLLKSFPGLWLCYFQPISTPLVNWSSSLWLYMTLLCSMISELISPDWTCPNLQTRIHRSPLTIFLLMITYIANNATKNESLTYSYHYSLPHLSSVQFQLLGHVQFFETPWSVAHQASLSFHNLPELAQLMSTN